MRTNDISTAYISFPGGGKRRPVFIISDKNGIVRFYKITTKYAKKSAAIKEMYFPINHWHEAGLRKQSYIDTITVGRINKNDFDLRVIGRLTPEDARMFEYFLERQSLD